MKITIEIVKTEVEWNNHKTINKTLMKKLTTNILNRFDNLKLVEEFELSILFASDKELLDLNSQFRGKHIATNVLSFPDIELNWQQLIEFKPNIHYMYLGDIAFAYQLIKTEANLQNKTFDNHFVHLFVHSVLHLLGFDHQKEIEAAAMESLEIDILKDFGIASPYHLIINSQP